ncbi:hypothetical protein GO308_01135 [Sphingomonas sp. SFZ2018-12]|uniref:hypothetical protein n=1 Tax=Sphingomonas sp. SFZ2018-12 TaxID=2683197 RepID=UPI001F0FEF70|nr:hypothetical protein [Sphingomonas sp. SFZ2018-12]MCH4891710.1 hypothetical protein [Sphingomonas sp. SFZ2018-12]
MAVGAATIAAACVASVPAARVEAMVGMSGLSALVPAAAPPLGLMARMALMFAAAWIAAGLVWALVRGWALLRPRHRGLAGLLAAPPKLLGRVDPPAREPVLATRDLGTPFLEVRAPVIATRKMPLEPLPDDANPFGDDEMPLPSDLETPLIAYAKGTRPAKRSADRVRIATFELPPAPAPVAPEYRDEPPITTPETEATIHALLARLEQGVARRGRPPYRPATAPASSRPRDRGNLEATLASLRRMAAQH